MLYFIYNQSLAEYCGTACKLNDLHITTLKLMMMMKIHGTLISIVMHDPTPIHHTMNNNITTTTIKYAVCYVFIRLI